jgi:hypothetical protein
MAALRFRLARNRAFSTSKEALMAKRKDQAAETELPEAQPAPAAETGAQATQAETGQPATPAEPQGPQRQYKARVSWAEQYTGPLQYEMFTAGKKIMFRFKLPKGQDKPTDEVLEVMRWHKQTQDEPPQPTGLKYENTRTHGKVWSIPNDPEGRELAGNIDRALSKLATKMELAQKAPG